MIRYEEKRNQDIPQTEVFDSLQVFLPEIKEDQIKFLYHGTYNVFEINNRYIFRFPDILLRNRMGVDLLNHEVKMLNFIQKYVSLKIPNPIFISKESENPFVGYEKINGISLSRCFNKTSKNDKLRITNEIGTFLSQLHSDKLVEKALSHKIFEEIFTPFKYKQEWQNYFDKIQTNVFSLMNLHQKNWILNHFNSFLKEEINFNFKPTIIHGDFDTSNILVDPKTFRVTGIIDFEESRLYDPAADFLFFNEGNFFLGKLLAAYEKMRDPNFMERMKFLYGCTCLHYIKFGVENNLNDMTMAGFQMLEHIMTRFRSLK